MPLTATRFANDPVLTACLEGRHRMLAPESGPAVRLVQEALGDLGFPPLSGADGQFGGDTGDAVVAFKTSRGIFPNDPVVGVRTMQALDAECADKPPAPFSSRDEWLSWQQRKAVPRVGAFNFTRQDEQVRRANGVPFTFDGPSLSWLPLPIQDALIRGVTALLDPVSPAGPGQPTPTWGVGPFDAFHVHLAMRTNGLPAPPHLNGGPDLEQRLRNLHGVTVQFPGAQPHNLVYTGRYAIVAFESGLLGQFAALANAAIVSATPFMPLVMVWHTFERVRWRPATMTSNAQERHWVSTVAPFADVPAPFPFVEHDMHLAVHSLFQISFFVNAFSVITALPGSETWTTGVVALSKDEVDAAVL